DVCPHQKGVSVSARVTYSRSDSLNRRYGFLVIAESQATYSWASSHDTLITGRLARPQLLSYGRCLQPPSPTQASHSSNVTAKRPTANLTGRVTVCCGSSCTL